MRMAALFLICWGLAFIDLSAALLLLTRYYDWINQGLMLRSVRQEAAIAGIASLVLGGSVWLIACFVPSAARALYGPELVVAFIYKVTHMQDWSRYEIILLLLFQIMLGCSAGLLISGLTVSAVFLWIVFGGILAIIGSLLRRLG
jgi:hypothetical protein